MMGFTSSRLSKQLIEKYPLNGEYLSFFINVVIASAKIRWIVLPDGTKIRGQIHCIIHGEPGTAKSTILNTISTNISTPENQVVPIMSLRNASFVGSVDKTTGMLIAPEIWTCRNNVLMIDEFKFDDRNQQQSELMLSMLQLTEFAKYKRKIGYRCNEVDEKDDDLMLQVKNSTLFCQTRFTLLMTTMFNPRQYHSTEMKALATRCLVLPYTPTREDIFDMIRGKKYYSYFEVPVPEKEFHLSREDMDKILGYLQASLPIPLIMRAFGDLVRIFAIIRRHDFDIYDRVIAYRLIYDRDVTVSVMLNGNTNQRQD